MATDYLTAFGTFPFLLFHVKELFDTIFLNAFKVFNHAHSEKGFVALVDMTKSFAREILTFITVFYLSIQE